MLPKNTATDRVLPFGAGDLLVIASDGLNEARNQAGEMFDYERLIELVDQVAAQPAEQILETLYREVRTFSQRDEQEDDQTVFVIKGV